MRSNEKNEEAVEEQHNDVTGNAEKARHSNKETDVMLDYSSEALIQRIFQLENPVLYDNMIPFLSERNNLMRVIEYLVKDYFPGKENSGDGSEFTDERCEKITSFLTSNIPHLHLILEAQGAWVVSNILHVFLYNNAAHSTNVYELSIFIKILMIKLPDDILPCIQEDDIRRMLMLLVENRAVFDILVLMLSYPEKVSDLEEESERKRYGDGEDDDSNHDNNDVKSCYNVSPVVLRRHIRLLCHLHLLPSIIVVITDENTDRELSDLLCCLLCDVLYKYSYNAKYLPLIKELREEEIFHRMILYMKMKPNPYIYKLFERVLYLISKPEIAVSPENYIRFGLLVDNYMENQFNSIASTLYDITSIYIMFLIKQLYRQIPSPAQLLNAIDSKYHLIDVFQLGDVSRVNSLREHGEMTIGTIPITLLRIIYYICLGFNSKYQENIKIMEDINPLYWNLLYALPFIYDQYDILHVVLRQYHDMFIFNKVDFVLIHILSNTPFTQYCFEDYCNHPSTRLKPHIRVLLHQLRLRVAQIKQAEEPTPSEVMLLELVEKDYYYHKVLPFIVSDTVKEVCCHQQKKILQDGVTTSPLECCTQSLLKEADVSKCVDLGSDFANKLGFQVF